MERALKVKGDVQCFCLFPAQNVTHIVICVFSPVSLCPSPNRWVLKKAGGVLAPALNNDTCRPVGTYTSHHRLRWVPTDQKADWSVPLNDYDAITKTNLEYDSIKSFVVIKCKPVKVVQTTISPLL